MDSETRRAIADLTRELLATQEQVRTLRRGGRTPRLGHSSIESGALEVRDPVTQVARLRIGYQPDGSVGAIVEGGDPPPEPSAPVVEAMASGLRVTWDGQLAEAEAPLPSDFDHVNVHVSIDSSFTPSPADFVATIPRAGGMLPIAPLSPGVTYYVRLVGVGTGGVRGEPSAQTPGTPTAVTDIEPGSITEVEIADDAISAPKIRAEAIQAIHIAAEQIQAGHIQAAAVTASKLAADLVLSTRIIAGNPGGARVELDGGGLRGYNADDELVFIIDDAGDVVFSGVITGSEIIGSRMQIGDPGGGQGVIEQTDDDAVQLRVTATNNANAQLRASSTQSEFSAFGDVMATDTPAGGLTANPGQVNLTMNSNNGDNTTPGAYLVASPGQATMSLRSERNGDGPRVQLAAEPAAVSAEFLSGSDSRIRIIAQEGWAVLHSGPEAPSGDTPPAHDGSIYSFRPAATDAPVLSLQSPVTMSGTGGDRRSILHVEGATPARPYSQLAHFAHRHLIAGELHDGATSTVDGQVNIGATHSVLSVRHRYIKGVYLDVEPTAATVGSFVDFTTAQWQRVVFRSSASGATRVVINASAINIATANSLINVGFRVGTYAGHRHRSAEMRAANTTDQPRLGCWVGYIDLEPDTAYTLVPQWRLSSGRWVAAGAENPKTGYMTNLSDNSIIVEPLT